MPYNNYHRIFYQLLIDLLWLANKPADVSPVEYLLDAYSHLVLRGLLIGDAHCAVGQAMMVGNDIDNFLLCWTQIVIVLDRTVWYLLNGR